MHSASMLLSLIVCSMPIWLIGDRQMEVQQLSVDDALVIGYSNCHMCLPVMLCMYPHVDIDKGIGAVMTYLMATSSRPLRAAAFMVV